MPAKVHTSALVLIPPSVRWEPIQAIRRAFDRHFERRMPHVTVLCPFRPAPELSAAVPLVAQACAEVPSFAVTLDRVRTFEHGRGRFTIWLHPDPPAPISELQPRLE